MTEPCDLTACQARRMIGEKRLSPVELLESCIARIEAVNPAVNAMVTTAFDRARTEAKAAEDAVMRGDDLPPLHGLPVGIKDLDANALLQKVGLADRAKDRVHKYSKGMRQRLMMARALVNTPKVLFLDEPTSGLDSTSTLEVLRVLRGLADRTDGKRPGTGQVDARQVSVFGIDRSSAKVEVAA